MANNPERWHFPGHPEPFRKSGHARSILHSSASSEAYTPPHILDAGRYTLGGVFDLDPCSNEIANEEVKARRFFSKGDDGLRRSWRNSDGSSATAWVNPPGGFLNRETLQPAKRGMSSACAWWYVMLEAYRAGDIKSGLYYTFRLDVLQNVQAEEEYEPPHAYPFCLFGERPRHWAAHTPKHLRGHKGQPTHACAVFLLPERPPQTVFPVDPTDPLRYSRNPSAPHGYEGASVDRFREAFEPLGFVRA